MIYEVTHFQVVCDHPGCLNEGPQSEHESRAKSRAIEDGFVEVDGKWFCESHVPKKKSRSKR